MLAGGLHSGLMGDVCGPALKSGPSRPLEPLPVILQRQPEDSVSKNNLFVACCIIYIVGWLQQRAAESLRNEDESC